MEYISRDMEQKFLHMSEAFKVVMLTGARQVGKSTMLRHLAQDHERTFVTMDNSQIRELAQSDPALFFQVYKPPILIDEVQKAPALFEHIKMLCDATDERGLFWLTGSQSRRLLREAGDTLAGRICILRMYSLSQAELAGVRPEEPLDFSYAGLARRSQLFPTRDIVEIYDHIWRGGMPDLQSMDPSQIREYWNSYIETYLIRDAVDDNGIPNVEGFRKFLRGCAAFTGQLLNYRDLAAVAGVSDVTSKEWIRVLQAMGIIVLLEPLFSNELKRMIKTPKLYFCDTGLCAYLSSWTSRDALMNGAASGRFFETYVVGELLRCYSYAGDKVNLNFYRDTNQKEIDLVVEQDGVLHPLEIKRGTNPDRKAVRTFRLLDGAHMPVGSGGIVCMTDRPFPLDEQNSLIPAGIL